MSNVGFVVKQLPRDNADTFVRVSLEFTHNLSDFFENELLSLRLS